MYWIQLLFIGLTGIYIIYKDLKERIIPDRINMLLLAGGVFVMCYSRHYISHLTGFFVLGTLMFLMAVITKGFGMGDVKYIYATGMLLGLKTAGYGLLIGIMLGGVMSAVLLALKKVDKKDYIPYGPYLVIGNFLAMILPL